MRHPLRENLEITDAGGMEMICCTRCHFQYCRAGQNWREFCNVRLLPPRNAGDLMFPLDEQYLLRQLYCPSCAALVETDFVEKNEQNSRMS